MACLIWLISVSIGLSGCASSNVSRTAAENVDIGVENVENIAAAGSNITDSYGNASQTTKGAILGGAAGAVAGALSSTIGVLPGTAIGVILGASYGRYIDMNATLKDQLINRGVNIVVLGDQILIVIPSARLFNPMSATITPQAYSTLYLVNMFINCFTKMLVRVSGYTADSGVCDVDIALSKLQAEHVADFLLHSGVNARVLYADGYGGSKLVVNNALGWDSDNYRIEITMEKLHV